MNIDKIKNNLYKRSLNTIMCIALAIPFTSLASCADKELEVNRLNRERLNKILNMTKEEKIERNRKIQEKIERNRKIQEKIEQDRKIQKERWQYRKMQEKIEQNINMRMRSV